MKKSNLDIMVICIWSTISVFSYTDLTANANFSVSSRYVQSLIDDIIIKALWNGDISLIH